MPWFILVSNPTFNQYILYEINISTIQPTIKSILLPDIENVFNSTNKEYVRYLGTQELWSDYSRTGFAYKTRVKSTLLHDANNDMW